MRLKLKKTSVILPLLFASFLSFATNPPMSINFIENNLESAKVVAEQEGKLIMVDFWATWCSPCKWMDEQTFNKPEVANYLNQNYVSVRVDIDNFDGLEYKNKYDIRFLPTIMVLDANGKVVKKYEESMAPSKLLRILKDLDENKVLPPYINKTMVQSINKPLVPREKTNEKVKDAPEFRPSLTNYAKPKFNKDIVTKTKRSTPAKPERTIHSSTENLNNTTTNNYNATIYKPSAPTKSKANKNYSFESNDGVSEVGLYQFNVKKAPKHGYSVQVGAYYDYKNVLIEVAKFQKTFNEEVLVHISEYNGSTCYKIMLGHYPSHQEATTDKVILKQVGAKDAFVKDLSTL